MRSKKIKIKKEYIEAQAFVESWFKALEKRPEMPHDRAAMLHWFTDAITAGFDAGYDSNTNHREL